MPFFESYKFLIFPKRRLKYLYIFLILVLLIAGDIIVEATGGTAFAYIHLLYIPIVLAGFVFSVRGGVIAAIIAGILMGPYMPTSIAYDIAQPLSSWALRIVMFAIVGALAGAGSSIFKTYLRELEHKHVTDALTGLPNLNGLFLAFSRLVQDEQKSCVIIVGELNRMAEIDRAFGEREANLLVQKIAEDLKKAIGETGILGRLQSHRFAILVPEQEDVSGILKSCESLLETTYYIGKIPLFIEIQFGLSRYPSDDKDLNNLIRKAAIAIHEKKHTGFHISYFNQYINDSSKRNLLILHQLKTAIEKKSLSLEYQPKVHLQTGKVMGFEALTRWFDPLLGPIAPQDFIPLTEETLLINPFTKWLLETVSEQMQTWKKLGSLVPISVNFSVKNFSDPSIIQTLNTLLETFQIPPHLLEIEVTETAIASNLSTIAETLKKLREVGVRILIDDFGTGQASQQYLFELPINGIKIDKLFIQSISFNSTAIAIVQNAISLAHDLKLEVIAEGIETHGQYELLKKWKCDVGQGYFIGHSMNVKEATDWLQEKESLLS